MSKTSKAVSDEPEFLTFVWLCRCRSDVQVLQAKAEHLQARAMVRSAPPQYDRCIGPRWIVTVRALLEGEWKAMLHTAKLLRSDGSID
jgi:hypothetical protein